MVRTVRAPKQIEEFLKRSKSGLRRNQGQELLQGIKKKIYIYYRLLNRKIFGRWTTRCQWGEEEGKHS